ncbi:MAG: class I SAM-dependent methyltransferase [Anaerolineales bacterium]|nr:class I SAM-dependent methyltransferase [Chloroflexota bacterium]MBL6981028.1 class I SAM-dependent methyltransferase [Anaerolineales bacterium]
MSELPYIPSLYHTHHSQDADDVPFWLEWAQRQGGPILELGCGTGRVLLPLAKAGHTLFGLDHDAKMLEFLRKNIPNSLVNTIMLIRGDLRSYCLTSRFPFILMPCNTYSTLSPKDRPIVLNRARIHLTCRGIFILSMPNPILLAEISQQGDSENEASFTHPETGNPVQVSSRWEKSADKVHFSWDYDHLSPDGRVERNTISSTHFLQDANEILGDFENAGLKIIHTFGDFEQGAYAPNAPNLIIVAKGE